MGYYDYNLLYGFIRVNMVIYLLNIVECWVWFLKKYILILKKPI